MGVKSGEPRDPNRLAGLLLAVARHIIYGTVLPRAQAVLEDRKRVRRIRKTLAGFSERDREIVTRFYSRGESAEQICAAMGFDGPQFQLFKSRLKETFTRA